MKHYHPLSRKPLREIIIQYVVAECAPILDELEGHMNTMCVEIMTKGEKREFRDGIFRSMTIKCNESARAALIHLFCCFITYSGQQHNIWFSGYGYPPQLMLFSRPKIDARHYVQRFLAFIHDLFLRAKLYDQHRDIGQMLPNGWMMCNWWTEIDRLTRERPTQHPHTDSTS